MYYAFRLHQASYHIFLFIRNQKIVGDVMMDMNEHIGHQSDMTLLYKY